jgi:hypothetical protein
MEPSSMNFTPDRCCTDPVQLRQLRRPVVSFKIFHERHDGSGRAGLQKALQKGLPGFCRIEAFGHGEREKQRFEAGR